jgi:hypothetical protein
MPINEKLREVALAPVSRLALSLEAAAEACGVRETLFFEAISTGRLRTKKWGARTLVLVSDLEKFIKSLPDRPTTRAGQQSTAQ